MTQSRIYLLIAFLTFLAPTAALAGGDSQTVTGLSYRDTGADEYADSMCRLDISLRGTTDEVRPVVVWFHGGGLTGGRRNIPQEIAREDIIVVAPDYRLMPRAGISECIDDAAAAVAWTFRNIAGYGGDTTKIFVAGHSAGGYLASMIGLDRRWLMRYGIEADSIAALIPYSGQTITHFALRQSLGISELQPTVDEFAPVFHIRRDAPPYIMITGDREQELYGRYEECAYMWRMMTLTGHPDVALFEIDGHDHGAMVGPAHHILLSVVRRISGMSQ